MQLVFIIAHLFLVILGDFLLDIAVSIRKHIIDLLRLHKRLENIIFWLIFFYIWDIQFIVDSF